MSLVETVKKIKQSQIWKLTYNGKILGFRVKAYSIQNDTFLYYDFDADIVKKLPELLEFFNSNIGSFSHKPLKKVSDRLYTEEELRKEYDAKELFSDTDVVNVLKPVILAYKGGVIDV